MTDISAKSLLDKVQWQKTASVPQFDDLEINYGFAGVNAPHPELHRAKQIHGNLILKADPTTTGANLETRAEADGVYTSHLGQLVGVMTADCLPVLIVDSNRKLAMAVHAGWRGVANGILTKAVNLAKSHEISPVDLMVALGPSISQKNYEVGPEVVDEIFNKGYELTKEQFELSVKTGKADRSFLSVNNTALFVLTTLGIRPENITVIDVCTYDHPNHWHSYRREKSLAGRNWSWAGL